MEILFDYGNLAFWLGVLIVVFLAVCDLCFNDVKKTLAEYRFMQFPQHLKTQRFCRSLFVVTLILALFAQTGANWQTKPIDFCSIFTNFMVAVLIYYVLCYPLVLVVVVFIKSAVRSLFMLLRLGWYAFKGIYRKIVDWINEK